MRLQREVCDDACIEESEQDDNQCITSETPCPPILVFDPSRQFLCRLAINLYTGSFHYGSINSYNSRCWTSTQAFADHGVSDRLKTSSDVKSEFINDRSYASRGPGPCQVVNKIVPPRHATSPVLEYQPRPTQHAPRSKRSSFSSLAVEAFCATKQRKYHHSNDVSLSMAVFSQSHPTNRYRARRSIKHDDCDTRTLQIGRLNTATVLEL